MEPHFRIRHQGDELWIFVWIDSRGVETWVPFEQFANWYRIEHPSPSTLNGANKT